jgi:hypothetical protein
VVSQESVQQLLGSLSEQAVQRETYAQPLLLSVSVCRCTSQLTTRPACAMCSANTCHPHMPRGQTISQR